MEEELSVCDVFNLDFCKDNTGGKGTPAEWTRRENKAILMHFPRSDQDEECVVANEKRVLTSAKEKTEITYLIVIGILTALICLLLLG